MFILPDWYVLLEYRKLPEINEGILDCKAKKKHQSDSDLKNFYKRNILRNTSVL